MGCVSKTYCEPKVGDGYFGCVGKYYLFGTFLRVKEQAQIILEGR